MAHSDPRRFLLIAGVGRAAAIPRPQTTAIANDTAASAPQNRVPIDGLPALGSERPLVTMARSSTTIAPSSARATIPSRSCARRRRRSGVVVPPAAAEPRARARAGALAALAADEQGRFAATATRSSNATSELDDVDSSAPPASRARIPDS